MPPRITPPAPLVYEAPVPGGRLVLTIADPARPTAREAIGIAIMLCAEALHRHRAAAGKDDALDHAVGAPAEAAKLFGAISLLKASRQMGVYFDAEAQALLLRLREWCSLRMTRLALAQQQRRAAAALAKQRKEKAAQRDAAFIAAYLAARRRRETTAGALFNDAVRGVGDPAHRAALKALGRTSRYALVARAEAKRAEALRPK
jgi:hypothetical protein